MKKIKILSIILMFVLVLSGCSNKTTGTTEYILPADDSFTDYLLDDAGIAYTPTFLFYEDGKLMFFDDGEFNPEEFTELYENSKKSVEELAELYPADPSDYEYSVRRYNKQGLVIYSNTLTTTDGSKINLSKIKGSICIEVVQTSCSHCKVQLKEHMDKIREEHPEITFIIYFINADNQGIEDFYKSL